MRTVLALMCIALWTRSVLAQQRPKIQTVTIGPWAIASTCKANKFANHDSIRRWSGSGFPRCAIEAWWGRGETDGTPGVKVKRDAPQNQRD
jgi:hypothetical protein